MAIIYVLIILASGILAQEAEATSVPEWGDIEIESSLSADSVAQNDTLVFTMKLKLRGNPDDYAIAEPGSPPVSNLTLVATSQANRTERRDGGTELIKEYRYSYTPISIGMAYFNPLRVQYVFVPNGESRSLTTSRLEIKVTEPVLPKESADWLVILIVVAIVIAGAAIAFVLSKKTPVEASPEQIPDPPEKTARERLAKLKPQRESDMAAYIDGITRILYNYIFDRYAIDTSKLSKREMVSALEDKGVSSVRSIDMALGICDEVRFAAHKPTPDDRDAIETALEGLLTFGEKRFAPEEEPS
ncbi:MAG TPA: hypothetical protein ENN07_03690 [candidate division Zixibacteria bacterium]|nr:hypothetical protein [candidate division Zixibacteria bacterium]